MTVEGDAVWGKGVRRSAPRYCSDPADCGREVSPRLAAPWLQQLLRAPARLEVAWFCFHLWTRQGPNTRAQNPKAEWLHGKARFRQKLSCGKREAKRSISPACSHKFCNSGSHKRSTGSGLCFVLPDF